MKTALIIAIFAAVTLGPLAMLMLRSLNGKKPPRPPASDDDD